MEKTIFGKFADGIQNGAEKTADLLATPVKLLGGAAQGLGDGAGKVIGAPFRLIGLDKVADGIGQLGSVAGKVLSLPFKGMEFAGKLSWKAVGIAASLPFRGVDLVARGVKAIGQGAINFATKLPIIGDVIKGMQNAMQQSSSVENKENQPGLDVASVQKGVNILKEENLPGVGNRGLDVKALANTAEKAAEKGLISNDLSDVLKNAAEKAQSAMPVAGQQMLTPDLSLGK